MFELRMHHMDGSDEDAIYVIRVSAFLARICAF